jgi:GT2 family glycosyltransferase
VPEGAPERHHPQAPDAATPKRETTSLIIATYNRVRCLRSLLEAVAALDEHPDETVVMVDGSQDGTMELLAEERRIPNLRHFWHPNSGRAIVRNRGAALAAHPLLLFLDDDMVPMPGFIGEHRAHHAAHPGTIVTGAAMNRPGPSPFSQYLANQSMRWSAPMTGAGSTPLPGDSAFLAGANFSVHRDIFRALGGFDERLTDAEDYDLGVRARARGIRLYYRHQAFAWHEDHASLRSYVARQRQYRLAHALRQHLTAAPPPDPGTREDVRRPLWKRAAFRLLAWPPWLRLLDIEGLLRLIPERARLRMFDWIITAQALHP